MAQHHPSDELLLQYASGALPEGLALFVASHLNYCPTCRRTVEAAEAVGGAMLDAEAGEVEAAVELNGHACETIRRRAEAIAPQPASHPGSPSDVPSPLRPYIGPRLDAVRWRTIWPGVQTVKIGALSDEGEVSLLRLKPGMAMPHHTHAGDELTLVLQGAFADETGRYEVGDVATADGALKHTPRADMSGYCVCLTAVDAPLVFSSRLTRWASRILFR